MYAGGASPALRKTLPVPFRRNQLFGIHQINFYFCGLFERNMKNPDEYQVSFGGLKPGTYTYEFRVGKSFFELEEDTEIRDGKVTVIVTMVREERMMDLHFDMQGTLTVLCDRCNEPLNVDVKGTERLIVKYGDRYYEESEEVQIIPESANQLDLSPFIYQYVHLLVPARKVHPEDAKGKSKCDPAILKKLEEMSGPSEGDPRWEALRSLKKKN